ncbi:MAG: GTP cyclohydrolase I FolE [Chloroflexota bacterium]|nr:GTP cyclohydrolase I FolE [Chloroflexota bacterium]
MSKNESNDVSSDVCFNSNKISNAVRDILESIGDDLSREGLRSTPERVAELYRELFSGMQYDPAEVLSVFFEENHTDPIAFTDIAFNSICEHHLLPFYGYAHVGYIPKGRVVGASKVARLVDVLSKRPQIQERLTTQIADTIHRSLGASSAYVFVSAEHMCMTLRGVKKAESKIVTSAQRGELHEVQQLIKIIDLSKS